MRTLLLVIPLLFAAASADAQIIRSRMRTAPPSVWVSGGVTLAQGWTVPDGATDSRWEFGNATLYGGSVEKALASGAAVGVRASTGRTPLRYATRSGPGATDADATVSSVLGTVRLASGAGFHSVLELSAGATIFSGFRARSGTALAPEKPDADFTFAFGYGFGYSFSPRFSVDVVQDLATTLHQRQGLSASDDSSVRTNATRFVVRYGLGAR